MKKTKLSIIAATVLTGALMVPAAAANAADLGGWDESQGSFTSEPSAVNDSRAAGSSLVRGAVNHRGKSEQKVIHGTTNKRAHGWTTWTNVYHYTTARMESYGGKVYNTSGRRWEGAVPKPSHRGELSARTRISARPAPTTAAE